MGQHYADIQAAAEEAKAAGLLVICSSNEYVFYREGGWSWSIPYIAGVYALAAQVKP